jgi:hypothetical protein
MTTPTAVTYELTLAANAKPFAWGPLAAALYVNDSVSDDCPRIVITTKPIALLDPKAPTSNASLVRKPEYVLESYD